MPEPRHQMVQACMFIDQFHQRNGYPPTIRELGAHLNMASPSTAHSFVKRMVRRGLITMGKGYARTMALTPYALSVLNGDESAIVTFYTQREPEAATPM